MTLRHLQIFVDVADSGKMTSAAEKLYISQSSVSQAIADLEEEYQVKLFERLNKRLYITEAGKSLLRYSRSILSLYNDMNSYMHNRKPTLRIGSTFTIAASILSSLVRELNKVSPDSKNEVMVERTGRLEQMLLCGELDIAFVEGTIESGDIVTEPILTDELVLLCSPFHPFFKRDEIYLYELQNQPFIQRESSSNTRKLFESELKKNGVQVYNKWICNNMEAIKSAAVNGQGLAIMSARIVQLECKNGQLKIVHIKDVSIKRYFTLAYHKDKYISSDLATFIEICRKYAYETGEQMI